MSEGEGAQPERGQERARSTWTAPGRLNVIGEHTDYNDGFVLPLALPFVTTATVAARDDGLIRMRSVQRGDLEVRVDDLAPGAEESWSSYVAGVVWALREAGHDVSGGFDVTVDGKVPVGAGLSSSAALECSVAAALDDLLGLGISRPDLALLAQRVENDYVGIPSGMMDQMASMLCTEANVLFLDCRSRETEQVPLDPGAAGLVVLGMDSRAPHQLTDGAYGERRRDCEAAARTLGVPALRDATEDDLGRLSGVARKRARHVVTEDARVLATVEALRTGRIEDVGPLLSASHASMRDDFEITVPRVDLLAAAAEEAGALGARMTGGGFGGCVVALVPADREDAVRDAVAAAYASAGFGEPGFFPATPSEGARKVS